MKYHVILLIALVSAAVLLDSSDAWRLRVRFRRVWRVVKAPICRWAVSKVCRVVGCTYAGPYGCVVARYGCSWASRKVCGRRRRRELVEDTLEKGDHLIPLPALFETYDLDNDEQISVQELALATGMDELETLNVVFPLCDDDGDGFLSHDEFINSPLIFEDPEDIEMERKEVAEEMRKKTNTETADTVEGSGNTSAKSAEDGGESAVDKSKASDEDKAPKNQQGM